VTCVGECGERDEAVAAIVERRPDVVLLDVQLGRATGFEIIEEIGIDAMPLVVFVTAYDRHALKAFDVHALDYILKPVDPERLREAIERAASMLSLQRGVSSVLPPRASSALACADAMSGGPDLTAGSCERMPGVLRRRSRAPRRAGRNLSAEIPGRQDSDSASSRENSA